MDSSKDIVYMRAALNLAEHGVGRTAPNPAVGCVLVKDGKVLAVAHTGDGGRPHAEAIALEKAGAEAKGATAYVTLEPCSHTGKTPPCAEALVKAGIKRAVIACVDPNPKVNGRGIEILKKAGIEVVTGVLEKEAKAMNAGFFLKILEQRPFVTLKVATTQDNMMAPLVSSAGEPHWLTGDMARKHSHIVRSMHDAILVGIGTVLADNPLLTTRLEGLKHTITRVVLDTHLKIPLESRLVKTAELAPVWVFYKDDPEGKAEELKKKKVKLFNTEITEDTEKNINKNSVVSVRSVLKALAEEGITRLLVEGGGQVHASFAKEGFGDRLLWYRAPQVMGEGISAFGGKTAADVAKQLGLSLHEKRSMAEDLLEIYEKAA